MIDKKKIWWVGGGLKITRQNRLYLNPRSYNNPQAIKNLEPFFMDNSTAMYIDFLEDPPFTAEDIMNKEIELWEFKQYIQQILEDKPDGMYYIHARPPPDAGRLHGLFCIPIAKLEKIGDDYDWEYKYTYKTVKYPYKRKKKRRYKRNPEVKKPHHQRKIYLIHDPDVFEQV